MRFSTLVRRLAAVAAITAAASGAILVAGAGTATAPGPADLKAPLYASTGSVAPAILVSTGARTTVLLWPGTYTSGGTAPAGTPCSTWGKATGERTTKQIVLSASGTQRKCV